MPTAAEVDILAALWRLGPATVREVHDALAKECGYNTTLKQMQIMTEKGLLVRNERFRSHIYEPAVPQARMQKRLAGHLLDRVFAGSAKELILGALGAGSPTAEELADIRQMIDTLEKRKRGEK